MAAVSEPVVSVTFDNLGEAAQLELGMWPGDVPMGQHFTVVDSPSAPARPPRDADS